MCSVTITSGVHNHALVLSEPHHRSNQHSLMSDGLIKEEEEKDSWFSLCCWVYQESNSWCAHHSWTNVLIVPLTFGNVGMANVFAWWVGTGGIVCAGMSQQARNMESYSTASEPCWGLDGSWVGIKSVLDGQAGTTWGREKGWGWRPGFGPLDDLYQFRPPV